MNNIDKSFGLEIEGCVKIDYLPKLEYNDSEILLIFKSYFKLLTNNFNIIIKNTYNSLWFNKFIKEPFIVFRYPESNSKAFLYNLVEETFQEYNDILEMKYLYPRLTSDPSLICNNTISNAIKQIYKNNKEQKIINEDDSDKMQYYLKKYQNNEPYNETIVKILQILKIYNINIYNLLELSDEATIGVEIITPPLFQFDDIDFFVDLFLLKRNIFKYNASCGIHITYNITNLNLKQLAKNIFTCYYNWQLKYSKTVRNKLRNLTEKKLDNLFGLDNFIPKKTKIFRHKHFLNYIGSWNDNDIKEQKQLLQNLVYKTPNDLNYNLAGKKNLIFKFGNIDLIEVRILGASISIINKLKEFVSLFNTLLFLSKSNHCEFNIEDITRFYIGGKKTKNKKKLKNKRTRKIKKNETKKLKNKKMNNNSIGKQYIFVYGSLREGGTNYNKIKDEPKLKKIGLGITQDKYSFIGAMSGAYPYASKYTFDGIDKLHIIGELYEVLTINYFDELDKLEYNYDRQIISVIVNGKIYNTYMYILNDKELIDGVKQNLYPNGKKRFYNITSGDWFQSKPI